MQTLINFKSISQIEPNIYYTFKIQSGSVGIMKATARDIFENHLIFRGACLPKGGVHLKSATLFVTEPPQKMLIMKTEPYIVNLLKKEQIL